MLMHIRNQIRPRLRYAPAALLLLLGLSMGTGQAIAETAPEQAGPVVSERSGPAAGEPGYGVTFNQNLIDRLQGAPAFDIDDTMAAFAHVFAALPDTVTVYPTENYFYFEFTWGGIGFAGNLRLDVADRDDGVLHFAYFSRNEPWNTELVSRYKPLTAADEVIVAKAGDLLYDVSYQGRTVRFALNDLSDVVPPDGVIAAGDRYLGPVFDESGLQFYLLFNAKRKDFLFVLNEQGVVDDLLLPFHPDHPALQVGSRTGFAFYEDRFAPRKILVGVYAGNVDLNTYFDGPFDQLPDNFIAGEELREAILAKHPDLDGLIDRLGAFRTQEGRFLVNPYVNYGYPGELERFLRCGDQALGRKKFYACLAPEISP